MIRAYRELDMQELAIRNLSLEKLDVEPVLTGEGRVWFSNGTNLPMVRAGGQNRFLVAPDDDFNNMLPLKETLYINDTLLIYDIENEEYRRIKASVILDKMSTIKDVFKTVHAETAKVSISAKDDDHLYFLSDGAILKTVGGDIGTKSIKYDFKDQYATMVLAGPLDVVSAKPTFRHLTDGDLPSSYNPENWNAAYDFSQIIEGNPANVTMADLGYIVVTTIGTPGLDENLPTEKAVRTALGLAIAALIDTSPGVLDTLNELAAALGDDPNFATTITTLIGTKEPGLGNPSVSGYFLSSTTSGVRSWINVPALPFASIVSDIFSSTVTGDIAMLVPWASVNKADGRLYYGTTNPTNNKRINYDGYFYATKLYIGANEVIIGEPSLGNPVADGYVLSSTAAGVRSWIAPPSGGVTPVSGILEWVTDKYQPYAIQTNGKFDIGIVDPIHYSSRLNYDGLFYTYGLYAGGIVRSGMNGTYSAIGLGNFSIFNGTGTKYTYFNPFNINEASAIAYLLDTSNNLTISGAKLLSVRNQGIEKFYIDKDGNVNIPTGAVYMINGVAIGGGGDLYTNAAATPQSLGGIALGSTFTDQTMQQMWDAFLYPYQVPVFNLFMISNHVSSLECGVNIAGGSQTFTWGTSNSANVAVNSIEIRDQTDAVNLATGLPNTGSYVMSITAETKTITGQSKQWGIKATNTQGGMIGYNNINTFFYSPFYYGVGAAGLSVAQVQSLTKSVSAKSNKIISYSPTSQKIYFAYPVGYGDLISIKDPNGFDITSTFTKTVVSFTNNPPYYYGITTSYNVYESNSLTTQVTFAITFNF